MTVSVSLSDLMSDCLCDSLVSFVLSLHFIYPVISLSLPCSSLCAQYLYEAIIFTNSIQYVLVRTCTVKEVADFSAFSYITIYYYVFRVRWRCWVRFVSRTMTWRGETVVVLLLL